MILRTHKLIGFSLLFATCFFHTITSQPQKKPYAQPPPLISPSNANQTGATTKNGPPRLSESYLPAVMQAIAYYVELIQYEPLHTTTIEPPFTLQGTSTHASVPNKPVFDFSVATTTSRPAATWATTTTTRPVTWWSSTTSRPTTWTWTPSTSKPTATSTARPITWWSSTTSRPTPTTTRQTITTTTAAWWNTPQTTPIHKPGYYSPEKPPMISGYYPFTNNQYITPKPVTARPTYNKPHRQPPAQIGDLAVLSISNQPYFDWYLHEQEQSKLMTKNADYGFLHQLPAELLQDIENEQYELPAQSDQDNVNEFRKIYDDFYTRVRIFAPQTGKKRVPPTKPYVLFLVLYDLLKREAKRLSLHDYEGYSTHMLQKLHETAQGSAERQLYQLMYELIQQNQLEKADVILRIKDIMEELANPYSVTAKALRYLKPLAFDY